jgi:hypothetical protein
MNAPTLRCGDVELLLADYVDQTLLDREVAQVKAHLGECTSCREFEADARAAVLLMERAAVVEAPPELINKILFEVNNGRAIVKAPWWQRVLFGTSGKNRLQQALQPRFAMGMAMTMLSFGMIFKTASVRELTPIGVYHAVEDRVTRLWDRSVKHYQSIQLVFELQSRYHDWVQEQEQQEQERMQQQQQQQQEPSQTKQQQEDRKQ